MRVLQFLARFKLGRGFIYFGSMLFFQGIWLPLRLVVPIERLLLNTAGLARSRYLQTPPDDVARRYCWLLVNQGAYLPGRAVYQVHAWVIAFYKAIGLWGDP